ncbi:MAG: branched-chain amino acid aminotransferase [Alphaproteobacteria bacterium]|jgi:branched-chain amino acid aminotransferase|nr:branched-chain amino acid aminotransferase [Alphaproteobacteria bacterium]
MDARFWHDGRWWDAQPKVLGPMDHAMWMCSSVFDGARIFDGYAPDLDRHCERLIDSAEKMLLQPTHTAEEVRALAIEAFRQMPRDKAYYVRPMFYAMRGFVAPEPESTAFLLAVYEAPMPPPAGFSLTSAPFRRPARDAAPVDAKAGCNYPNGQRALVWARRHGFDNALVLDACANVAELATANIWLVKDGVALTPACNGTFLNGITRQRLVELLVADGIEVRETTLGLDDVAAADEIFSTGNYGKVMPCVRYADRALRPGPLFRRARELYLDYAASRPAR